MHLKKTQAILILLPKEYRKIGEPVFMVYEFRIEKLEAEAKYLSDQLAKKSRNSNKLPSSDTFNKPAPKSLRKKTDRKPGGQKGHDGTTLKMVDYPDLQVTNRVEECEVCKNHLGNEVAGQIERRQLYDLPDLELLVTDAIRISPEFKDVAVQDFWKPYYHYACDHALCIAHLLRELTFTKKRCKQTRTADFISFFLQIKAVRGRAIAQGKSLLSKSTLQWYRNSYDDLIKRGLAVNPIKVPPEKSKGRVKKTKARNLLERFRSYHEDILRFFYDFDVPFDNNPSERDIRMAKVKQKISKGFRTFTGARYFARTRSFVSTAQKQHISILDALKDLFGDNQIQFSW